MEGGATVIGGSYGREILAVTVDVSGSGSLCWRRGHSAGSGCSDMLEYAFS